MRFWYLILFLFFVVGCTNDNEEKEYKEIKVEKHYPYFYETKGLDDIDDNTLWRRAVFSINSITQLTDNILFARCSSDLQRELRTCDFDKYTLIIASSVTIYEVTDLKSFFGYNNFSLQFIYYQIVYGKPVVEPIERANLIINALVVKKLPDDPKITFVESLSVNQPE